MENKENIDMQLNMSCVKNETLVQADKALKTVKKKFDTMLFIALNAAVHEIDAEKRSEVESVVMSMIEDEHNKFNLQYTKLMNKVGDIIESGLNS